MPPSDEQTLQLDADRSRWQLSAPRSGNVRPGNWSLCVDAACGGHALPCKEHLNHRVVLAEQIELCQWIAFQWRKIVARRQQVRPDTHPGTTRREGRGYLVAAPVGRPCPDQGRVCAAVRLGPTHESSSRRRSRLSSMAGISRARQNAALEGAQERRPRCPLLRQLNGAVLCACFRRFHVPARGDKEQRG